MATERSLFEREHHQRIAALLGALDAELLARHRCLFGGGTAIALRYGEYRLSRDIDFIVSSLDAYRELRLLVTSRELTGLFKGPVKLLRETRADQYGIRNAIALDGGPPIKFEIVLEARIELDEPAQDDVVCGVATLTPVDMAATKLLANSDRWADDSVDSRDLIDLAMLLPTGRIPAPAMAKAERAYGASVSADLAKATDHLLGRPGRLRQCMLNLGMELPEAQVLSRIKKLRVPGAGARAKAGSAAPAEDDGDSGPLAKRPRPG